MRKLCLTGLYGPNITFTFSVNVLFLMIFSMFLMNIYVKSLFQKKLGSVFYLKKMEECFHQCWLEDFMMEY